MPDDVSVAPASGVQWVKGRALSILNFLEMGDDDRTGGLAFFRQCAGDFYRLADHGSHILTQDHKGMAVVCFDYRGTFIALLDHSLNGFRGRFFRCHDAGGDQQADYNQQCRCQSKDVLFSHFSDS